MSEFLSKIENFLFDILGLALPGLIFTILLISPIFLVDISKIPECDVDSSYILSALSTISLLLTSKWTTDSNLVIALVIIFSYLIGHFVKVFSIIEYDFLTVIFDKSINKLAFYFFELVKSGLNWLQRLITKREMYSFVPYQYLKTLFAPIKNTLGKIFSFKSSDYMEDNTPLRTSCVAQINQKLGTNYPDVWYSIYKISSIISSQGKVILLQDIFWKVQPLPLFVVYFYYCDSILFLFFQSCISIHFR